VSGSSLREAPGLLQALNVHVGKLTYKAVAESLGVPWTAASRLH
jgi:alanine dehydrogenase